MTFEEKVIKLVNDRSLALAQKRGLALGLAESQEERDFNYKYLFGEGSNEGINDLFAQYANEMYQGVGKNFSSPNLRSNNDNDWKSRLTLSVTLAGDGDIYLDSDSNGVANKTINPASQWLGNNADNGVTTAGLIATLNSINTAIGNEASDNSNGRGPYADLPEAETQRDADRGSELYGARTENSEIYQNVDDYYIGQAGIDNPDYFNEPERSALLTALSNSISGITSYIATMETILPVIAKIQNDQNELFLDMDAKSDSHFVSNILGDPVSISTVRTALEGHRSDLQTYYDYFNQFSASDDISGQSGYDKTTFNTYLDSSLPTVITSTKTTIQNRTSSILSKLGTISTGLKKYRYFWAVENVKKPVSPLIEIQGIQTAQPDVNQQIGNANTALNLLLGDADSYVTTPILLSSAYIPFTDPVTRQIVENRCIILWTAPTFCNKYRVYRRIYNGETPNNNNWAETEFLSWVYEIDEETNFIIRKYIDPSYTVGTTYQYRIQALDTSEGPASFSRIDSFNSKSLQSKLYNNLDQKAYSNTTNGFIVMTDEHNFKKNQYIAVIGVGFYKIDYVDKDGNIQLINTGLNNGAGNIATAYGIVDL